jgi:hypothetical protein
VPQSLGGAGRLQAREALGDGLEGLRSVGHSDSRTQAQARSVRSRSQIGQLRKRSTLGSAFEFMGPRSQQRGRHVRGGISARVSGDGRLPRVRCVTNDNAMLVDGGVASGSTTPDRLQASTHASINPLHGVATRS